MKRVIFLGLLIAVVAPAYGAIRVAVETGGASTATAAAVAAQLNDSSAYDFNATVVSAGQIDSLAELANYDVVVMGDSGYNDSDWTAAMASALRQWVELGHGAVMTGWGNLDTNVGDPWNADLEAIFPTQNGPSTNDFVDITDTIHFTNTVHPVTQGLTDFAPNLGSPSNTCCIEVNPLAPEGNDTVLAVDNADSSQIIVAVKSAVGAGNGRSVYLGPVYFANTSYPDAIAALRTGQADQLLEQSVAFAAGVTAPASVPTFSPSMLAGLAMILAVVGAVALRVRT